MNTLNHTEINKISGFAHMDPHFDVMYMVARREQTEAMRRAAMHRLAQSVVKQRHAEVSRRTPALRTMGTVQMLLHAVGRIGRIGRLAAAQTGR